MRYDANRRSVVYDMVSEVFIDVISNGDLLQLFVSIFSFDKVNNGV